MNLTIIRNDTNDIVTLLKEVAWINEFDWVKLAQSAPVHTLGGAVHVQQGKKLAGRSMVFEGWVRRDAVLTLQDWAAVEQLRFTVTLPDTRVFEVIFSSDNPIAARPVRRQAVPDPENWYRATLRFMTI